MKETKTILTTTRTCLKTFSPYDLEDVFSLTQNIEVMKMTGFKEAKSLEQTKELLEKWCQDPDVWIARERVGQKLIGWFMLKATDLPDLEIGFMIAQNQWSKGFATEVSEAIIDRAKANKVANEIYARVHSSNTASIRVLKKLKMKQCPITDPQNKETCVFKVSLSYH